MLKYPFVASSNKVNTARVFLPVLKTFVAPIFPEPIFLMSFFKKNLIIIRPKGIEPSKYEYINTSKKLQKIKKEEKIQRY